MEKKDSDLFLTFQTLLNFKKYIYNNFFMVGTCQYIEFVQNSPLIMSIYFWKFFIFGQVKLF